MPETGAVLQGRYQLQSLLSDNPVRETWLATDLTNEEPVVVKLLVFGGQKQWENLKLFDREAKVLQNLQHPQIPRYRDYFTIDDNQLWSGLVQDYIPGSSLMQQLDAGKKYTEEEARNIATALLEILTYLHQLSPPVLHRDIKPSNIIFSQDAKVYLVDFGAVQDQGAVAGRSFTVVGTYGYTPLEQFGGQTVPASDLYALGATLVHLLTGVAPGELLAEDLHLQFQDRLSTNLSPYFIAWLEKLTEPQLSQRFRSASEALSALQSGSLSIPNSPFFQPDFSQVKLRKNQRKLEIIIPEPSRQLLEIGKQFFQKVVKVVETGISALQKSTSGSDISSRIFVYILIGIGGVSILSALMQVIMGALPLLIPAFIAISFTEYFERTNIYLDRDADRLAIEHKRLGLTYRTETAVASKIQDVSIFYDNKKFVVGVMITAGSESGSLQQYPFGNLGRKMTEEECIWLAQEMRNWLGIE